MFSGSHDLFSFNSLLIYEEVHAQQVIFKHKFTMVRLCTFMRRCRVPWLWQHKPWCTQNWVQHIWLSNIWGISSTPWGFSLSSYKFTPPLLLHEDHLIQHMAGLHEKGITDPFGQRSNGHGSYRLVWLSCKSINLRNAVQDRAARCALSRVACIGQLSVALVATENSGR